MNHNPFITGFQTLNQGGPVIWPLLFCAVLAVAVILERWLTLRSFAKTNIADGLEPSDGRLAERALQLSAQLRKRLVILDTIITIAPLLGLLGTVTGMIGAFHVVSIGYGNLSASSAITGGVAQALIATALGLVIALVSLVGYNSLTAQVQTIEARMTRQVLVSSPVARRRDQRHQSRQMRRPALKKARIEIIPMIDTIFFLLVFFMLTSLSLVQVSGHHVQMPVSRSASQVPGTKVVVTLAGDGATYVDSRRVSELAILSSVAARVNEDPETVVLINCDRTQSANRFLRALDLVKQANPKTVMIATKPGEMQPVPEVTHDHVP